MGRSDFEPRHARGQIMTPSILVPSGNDPMFDNHNFLHRVEPQAVVTPDGVIIQEAGDPPVKAPSAEAMACCKASTSLARIYLIYQAMTGLRYVDLENSFTLGFASNFAKVLPASFASF